MATFVLVPGAGGDPWTWHRLVGELQRRGHAAVPVELPADDGDAGLDRYAEIVVTAAAGHDALVVVGHSMGALTAPLVCARLDVRLLVLLNPMIPRRGETGHEWWTSTRHVATDLDVEALFFNEVPADITAEALGRPVVDQSARPFEDPWPLSTWPDVPTRVIQGRDDRFFPLAWQQRVAHERLLADVHPVPGGHLCALSHPVELADALVSALATTR